MKKYLILLLLALFLSGCARDPGEQSSFPAPTAVPTEAPTVPPSEETAGSVPETAGTSAEADLWHLGGRAVKTVYVSGERFDPTGLYAVSASGKRLPPSALTLPEEPLEAGRTGVTLLLDGQRFSVPVTVVPGKAGEFVSAVSASEEAAALQKMIRACGAREVPQPAAEDVPLLCLLEDPCPGGTVRSRQELADYVDYHAFYGLSSVTVRFGYPAADPEEELNDLYLRSSLIAGNAALQICPAEDGWFQILLRYYGGPWYCAENAAVSATNLALGRKVSGRTSFSSPRVSEDGITVFTSDQAVYALLRGHKIAPVRGSAAEKAVLRAEEILAEYADDSFTDWEKLYQIFLYFLDRSMYDHSGDNAAGAVPDPAHEPDLLLSRLVSFRAEGPLFYGNAACYGYAKASALLLSLEGFSAVRVLTREEGITGRTVFRRELLGGYSTAIEAHSYLYVHLDDGDYIFDPAFTSAGSVSLGSTEVVWYRDPCAAYTFPEHRAVYTSLADDLYVGSPAYRPGKPQYLPGVGFEGGESLILKSKAELEAAFDALRREAASSSGAARRHSVGSCCFNGMPDNRFPFLRSDLAGVGEINLMMQARCR
ncbi:MAG: hypothetical protein IKI82_01440 [Lachnospiraceae bacterium]|nr:hypothetical protein [Lachnospiraceae bacterium]